MSRHAPPCPDKVRGINGLLCTTLMKLAMGAIAITGVWTMLTRIIAVAPLAAILATTANAAHQPTTLRSEARGLAQTSNGVTVSAGADVWWNNGAVVGTPSAFGVGGASAMWNAGPDSPGATENWATTLADAGIGRVATAASASLDRGELKAVVDNLAIAPFASSGVASARFADAIWFNNTSGEAQAFTLSMAVDGGISGSGTRAEGFSYIGLSSGAGATCNSLGDCITPNPGGTGTTSFALYGQIDRLAAPGADFFFREQLGGTVNNDIPWWTFSFGAGHDPASGLYDYVKSLTLYVPTGETTLFLEGWLNLTICNGNFRCNFGNTSAIRFSAMPEGLSWTSQSGAFLSAVATPPGGVIPEPATWGLMIAGFGLVGSFARRRRRVATAG
jgi:hypothetical protein